MQSLAHFRSRWTFISCLLLCLFALPLVTQAAGPYSVNSNNDTGDVNTADGICEITIGMGDCSIRAAIEQANADAVPTTIFMFSSLSANVNTPLVITGDIDIIGDVYNVDISGNGITRVLEIAPGGDLTMNLVRTAIGSAAEGGCIRNQGNLTLINAEVLQCTASGNGGGIVNESGGVLTIQAPGGVGGAGQVIWNNTAGVNGGAIYNKAGGVVRMYGGAFNNNHANGEGGAIYNEPGGDVLVEGFIYNTPGPTPVQVVFNQNSADGNGGAVSNRGILVLGNGSTSSGFGPNTSGANGGALYNEGNATIHHFSVQGSTAVLSGGGIYNSGLLNIDHSSIYQNTATGNGGGIYQAAGSMTLSNVTIAENTTPNFGGGVNIQSGTGTFTHTTHWTNLAANGREFWLEPGVTIDVSNIIASHDQPALSFNIPGDCAGGGTMNLLNVSQLHFNALPGCTFTGPGTISGSPADQSFPSVNTPAVQTGSSGFGGFPSYIVPLLAPSFVTDNSTCTTFPTDQTDTARDALNCYRGAWEGPQPPPVFIGTISGFVTSQTTGLPLVGLCVDIVDVPGGSTVASTTTGGNGEYLVSGLVDGDYQVRAYDCRPVPSYADEWYNQQPTQATAVTLTISGQNTLTNINFTLQDGGTMTGTVCDDGTTAMIPGISVFLVTFVSGNFQVYAQTTTDALGNYSFGNVGVGTYYVAFLDLDGPANGGPYIREWFDNQPFSLGPPDPLLSNAFPFVVTETPGIKGLPPTINFNAVVPACLSTGPPTGGGTNTDVGVTKAVSVPQTTISTQFDYTISTTNNGPLPTTNVVITDTLPANITPVSLPVGCTQAGQVITCNLGNLASGQTVLTTFPATGSVNGTFVNTVVVTHALGDPVLSNDTATAEIEIGGDNDDDCDEPDSVPSGLTAHCEVQNGQILLTWDRHLSGNREVTIQYMGSSGHWHRIDDVEDDGRKVITGLHDGETYTFRIAFENSCGRGEYSRTATAIPCAFPATGESEITFADWCVETWDGLFSDSSEAVTESK